MKTYRESYFDVLEQRQALAEIDMSLETKRSAMHQLETLIEYLKQAIEEAKYVGKIWTDLGIEVRYFILLENQCTLGEKLDFV